MRVFVRRYEIGVWLLASNVGFQKVYPCNVRRHFSIDTSIPSTPYHHFVPCPANSKNLPPTPPSQNFLVFFDDCSILWPPGLYEGKFPSQEALRQVGLESSQSIVSTAFLVFENVQ